MKEGSGVGNSVGPAVGSIVPREGRIPLPPTGFGVGIGFEKTGDTVGPSVDGTDDDALALGEALSKVGSEVGEDSLQSRHLQVANVDSKKRPVSSSLLLTCSSFQNPTEVPSMNS